MKLLVAVRSCQRDVALHNTIRATWGRDAKAQGVDVRFFVGASFQKYENDEVHLQCHDNAEGLGFKTREIFKWAVGKQIDYLFLCYTTSPGLWLDWKDFQVNSGLPDYMGSLTKGPLRYPYVPGKSGYLLSRSAFSDLAYEYPGEVPEDQWVGQYIGAQAAIGEFTVRDVK